MVHDTKSLSQVVVRHDIEKYPFTKYVNKDDEIVNQFLNSQQLLQ